MLRSAVAVVLGLAFALPASEETLTLTSQYDVSGTNTNGSKYTVKCQHRGDIRCHFQHSLGHRRIDLHGIRDAHE
jgi:hypothetical protein